MTKATTTRLQEELLKQEREYLRAVTEKDGDAAARLTADESLVVSGRGAMRVDGNAVRQMVEQHDATRTYELDEDSAQVVPVTDDVSIITYKLLTATGAGEAPSTAFDTDVWVRKGGQWVCALHVEVPAA